MSGSVLVVDDQELPRRALVTELRDLGFSVSEAADGEKGWDQFCHDRPDVVVTDLSMPHSDGLALLTRIRSRSDIPVILFSAHGTVQTTAAAFKAGANEFFCSAEVEIEEIVNVVIDATRTGRSQDGAQVLADHWVGSSPATRHTRERLAGLAPLRSPVLVSGPPGSGRSTAVRLMHEFGHSAGRPLANIQANSHALDPREAPPGAVHLENIETYSTDALTYWSNFIRTRESTEFRDGPRIFLSSKLSLHELAQSSEFREGPGRVPLRFAIELPTLASCREDAPEISRALVKRIGASVGRMIQLSPAALNFISNQRWNVSQRVLEEMLHEAVVFTRGRQIRREVMVSAFDQHRRTLDTFREQHLAREKELLISALERNGGNISRTATQLEKSRSAVYRLIAKHDISPHRKHRTRQGE
ncbi:response regulator [Myxococcota bacterium]|nr:response regulator [Myxococcota bacterium]